MVTATAREETTSSALTRFFLRLWRFINHLLTYLLNIIGLRSVTMTAGILTIRTYRLNVVPDKDSSVKSVVVFMQFV